jgi:hypothetical protein
MYTLDRKKEIIQETYPDSNGSGPMYGNRPVAGACEMLVI